MRCPGILDPRNILDDNQLQQQQRLPQALNRRSMSSLSYSTSQTPVQRLELISDLSRWTSGPIVLHRTSIWKRTSRECSSLMESFASESSAVKD
uniref:Uncharacterized protein n=1 Tax=Mesocestoides corti TaxID=53468 RepID=A0A5K3G0B9_MESCO